MVALVGVVALGGIAGTRALGSAESQTITCLGAKILGDGSGNCGSSASLRSGIGALPPPPTEEPPAVRGRALQEVAPTTAADSEPVVRSANSSSGSSSSSASSGSSVPLHETSYRISDDINNDPKYDGKDGRPNWKDMVTPDHPGRTMEVAGNSTMTWPYGQTNAVGVCRNLASKIGVSEQQLFSGGTCIKVGSNPATYRVQDQLEDGQGCGDASKQHIDFHVGAYNQVESYRAKNPGDTDIKQVDCGTKPSTTSVVFRDYDSQQKDGQKAVRFNKAPGPVTKATIVTKDGTRIEGTLGPNGTYLFKDPNGKDIVGSQNFEITTKGPDGKEKTEKITIDVPKASDIHGTEVRGNDAKRAGTLDTLEVAPGETASDALARAKKRVGCVKYLTDHPDATRADAASKGGCS